MSALIYRRAFTDAYGLRTFAAGQVPDLASVMRRIFVMERRSGPERPDHFYKNYLEARLGSVSTVAGLPWCVLGALAERFVERRAGRLRIKAEAFEDWRQALPMISPLAVIVAHLVAEGGPPAGDDPRPFLRRELGDSALLAPVNPFLEAMIERDGLNEMHMHLNGSTEADILWADAVRFPREYHDELLAGQDKDSALTAELYDQVELGLSPYEIYRRLRAARRVRHAMAEQLRLQRQGRGPTLTITRLLTLMNVELDDREARFEPLQSPTVAPVTAIWAGGVTTELVDEAAWLFACLRTAATPGPLAEIMGLGLYFNLLVHTLIGRISIQQVDEVGFDQFQKYTVIGVRERLERVYEKRLNQLNVAPPHRVLTHLEGRVAPKKTVGELAELIDSVAQGWLRFRGCPQRAAAQGLRGAAPPCMTGGCGQGACARDDGSSGRPDSELSLVIHFIKRRLRPAPHVARQCLDGRLRVDLAHQAAVVRMLLRRHPFAAQIVRGIDAAANELHAAPEVFSATFRYLRRSDDLHATFHVGEDFTHLLSGIRATAEALTYLTFGAGDRLGHATALGTSPRAWLARTGERMILTRGEHLDNAVFAHATLGRTSGHEATRSRLEEIIARRSAEVYGRECSAQLLHQAWRLRGLDILELMELERGADLEPGDAAAVSDAAQARAAAVASADRQAELLLIHRAASEHPLAFGLFRQRHLRGERCGVLVEVQTAELGPEALCAMQDNVLGEVNAAGVVLETLPTSNVRIAAYRDLSEHHVFRWLGLTGEPLDNRPTVCVGSDDTGIFATSLRNEYAALFSVLTRHHGRTPEEAIEIVRGLNQTGFAFRFRPLAEAPPRRL